MHQDNETHIVKFIWDKLKMLPGSPQTSIIESFAIVVNGF